MEKLLPTIGSPHDLENFTLPQLEQLAAEMRDALCQLASHRTAHFSSNLGVVELCIALHATFDFSHDRLIWDTGHQIYPHKLITGRYDRFSTMRTRGGLMGYPNPAESSYDLFMTGHAGASLSAALGLKCGDDLAGGDRPRRSVAVIGDGAFPCGMVYEAMNHAGGLKKELIVVLNDNQMSICPRVGGMADYLDRLRLNPVYTGFKDEVVRALGKMPLLGDPVERFLAQLKEAVKAGLHGGMLFEELGFRYLGPIDGHNVGLLRKYFRLVKDAQQPVLLHVVTEKGHGFHPAARDPVSFHTPPPFERDHDQIVSVSKNKSRSYTHVASAAILDQMTRDRRVTVLTAAMCQGNKLEKIRDRFPDRFFDTGICESHTVAFAAGQAKAGLRPIVDIYSTFLQRSLDQIFQEVTLQNLPVVFMMDRSGLTGPDGPTHHGVFDLGYMRLFPNMTVMAPGDETDLVQMLQLALKMEGPCAIRYPKAAAESLNVDRTPVEPATAEVLHEGDDGVILCCGTLLGNCMDAATTLRAEGLDVGVVNMRFVKPIDRNIVRTVVQRCGFVLTVEEAALAAGFGTAVLEVAAESGAIAHIHRRGIPDQFVEHAQRNELLSDLGLDTTGIADTCRRLALEAPPREHAVSREKTY